MSLKTFVMVIFLFAILFLNACSGSEEDGETNVALFNKKSLEEQIKASDSGYCPLLPYPSVPCIDKEQDCSMPTGLMFIFLSCKNREEKEAEANSLKDSILPDGKPYINTMSDFSFCDNLSESEVDSLQKIYDAWMEESESLDTWQEEVWKVRRDPTRIATLTISENQTIINLSPVFVEATLDFVQLKGIKKNDTLYITVISDKNGNYDQMKSASSCPVSLDLVLDYIIDENIKIIVFEEEQIFQAKFL
jgi:hypothetical protein